MTPPNPKKKINGLYIITPTLPDSEPKQWLQKIKEAIRGGARAVQFRDKSNNTTYRFDMATELKTLCCEFNIPLIINDDVNLAKEIQADGVHLGAEDASIARARETLGERAIIGVSCYNQLDIAKTAVGAGADYVAFGRFFPSATKPDAVQATLNLLSRASVTIDCPIIAIGGITVDNASSVIQAGATAIAVIDAVFSAANTYQASQNLQKIFNI